MLIYLFQVQVSLAIRGGYVPEKFGNRKYQNRPFRLKLCFSLVIRSFPLLSGPRIVKTVRIAKTRITRAAYTTKATVVLVLIFQRKNSFTFAKKIEAFIRKKWHRN